MSTSPARPASARDWSSRPVVQAWSAGHLSGLIEAAGSRSSERLFTVAGGAEQIDEVARWQRLEDLAWAGKARALMVAHDNTSPPDREFLADEVALALRVGSRTGDNGLDEAVTAVLLPGLVKAVDTGRLTVRHVKAVLRTLRELNLTEQQNQQLVTLLLTRLDGTHTPGQLTRLLTRLALMLDLDAAQKRKDLADQRRHVHVYGKPEGQASCVIHGPAERIEQIRAVLDATLPPHPQAGDGRCREAREFDLLLDLLTGQATGGAWHASIVVPFHTATGGNLELAELPGLGPVLPATARALLGRAAGWSRISVDEHGVVLSVDTPTPIRANANRSAPCEDSPAASGTPDLPVDLTPLLTGFTTPPAAPADGTAGYRIPERLRRQVRARDQTCVFPGCGRTATTTDLDHRIPWPRGSTTADNLHCLCRHHHRAKQAGFTPEPNPTAAPPGPPPTAGGTPDHPTCTDPRTSTTPDPHDPASRRTPRPSAHRHAHTPHGR